MARDAVKISRNLDDNAIGNVLYSQLSDGTDVLAINADGSLNVAVNNASLTVTATDLDIRDLSHTQDSVKVGDGTDFLAVAADGSIAVTDNGASLTVDAVNLDIRDLTSVSDSVSAVQSGAWNIGTVTSITNAVTIQDGGNAISIDDNGASITVDGTVAISGTVTVSATDLDIRDLSHTQDSVKVGDGTDLLAVNADGSINVVVGGSSGTAVADYDQSSLATATSDNHDYTASGGAFKPSRVQVSGESIATFTILTGPVGTLVTRAVLRTSVEHPNAEFIFPEGFSIASTEIVRVTRTNDSNKTKLVDSTITGSQL